MTKISLLIATTSLLIAGLGTAAACGVDMLAASDVAHLQGKTGRLRLIRNGIRMPEDGYRCSITHNGDLKEIEIGVQSPNGMLAPVAGGRFEYIGEVFRIPGEFSVEYASRSVGRIDQSLCQGGGVVYARYLMSIAPRSLSITTKFTCTPGVNRTEASCVFE